MRTAKLDAANTRLFELSYHDELTGLPNRRCLLERLGQLEVSENTVSTPARHALILVDVDHFKACNDHFGHPAGDQVLRQVATTMLHCVPDDALISRYGGEEFACLLPGAYTTQAVALAERVRAAVEACRIPIPGETGTIQLTISAGVASIIIGRRDDSHQLLRDADMAMYQAKHDGRNLVRTRQQARTASPESEQP